MKKYNSHLRPKKEKKQKYPAPKKKYVPDLPIRKLPALNKPVNPDEVFERIKKACDEANNKK